MAQSTDFLTSKRSDILIERFEWSLAIY